MNRTRITTNKQDGWVCTSCGDVLNALGADFDVIDHDNDEYDEGCDGCDATHSEPTDMDESERHANVVSYFFPPADEKTTLKLSDNFVVMEDSEAQDGLTVDERLSELGNRLSAITPIFHRHVEWPVDVCMDRDVCERIRHLHALLESAKQVASEVRLAVLNLTTTHTK